MRIIINYLVNVLSTPSFAPICINAHVCTVYFMITTVNILFSAILKVSIEERRGKEYVVVANHIANIDGLPSIFLQLIFKITIFPSNKSEPPVESRLCRDEDRDGRKESTRGTFFLLKTVRSNNIKLSPTTVTYVYVYVCECHRHAREVHEEDSNGGIR